MEGCVTPPLTLGSHMVTGPNFSLCNTESYQGYVAKRQSIKYRQAYRYTRAIQLDREIVQH